MSTDRRTRTGDNAARTKSVVTTAVTGPRSFGIVYADSFPAGQGSGLTDALAADAPWLRTYAQRWIRVAGTPQVEYLATRLHPDHTTRQMVHEDRAFTKRVVVETRSGHRIYLAMLQNAADHPRDAAALHELADRLLNADTTPIDGPAYVLVPAIKLDDFRVAPSDDVAVGQLTYTVPFSMTNCGINVSASHAGTQPPDDAFEMSVFDGPFALAITDGTEPKEKLIAAIYSGLDSWQVAQS